MNLDAVGGKRELAVVSCLEIRKIANASVAPRSAVLGARQLEGLT